MNLEERKRAFVQLGKIIGHFVEKDEWKDHSCGVTKEEYDNFNELILRSKYLNGWFTESSVRNALSGIANMLDESVLEEWLSSYPMIDVKSKKVGVIMAGNIPMVGFHDMLCVLLSGHHLCAKLSSEDKLLLPAISTFLISVEPRFEEKIQFVTQLKEAECLIATGSDNSAQYFESYFGHLPNIIRRNRTSVAVISGEESKKELRGLANDVFLYFGKGCRNVTKFYLPENYDLNNLFEAFYPFKDIIHHNKYANNYDYNKAIYLMNKIELIENGFLMLKEDESLHSPLSIIHYQYYKSKDELDQLIKLESKSIQCIVGNDYVPFGKAQFPSVSDYADGVDTMKFLLSL